jgi:ABC-type nitrate/sulfonate/bicarbonate transport system substrate-binding protein
MRRVKVFSSVIVVFLLCFIFAVEAQTKDINLGWSGQGSWTTLPYVVAKEKGFFEMEGLKVQLITFRGTNLMLTALLGGELITLRSYRFSPAQRRAVCL